eukprot:771040-Amphidinium_carterae.1
MKGWRVSQMVGVCFGVCFWGGKLRRAYCCEAGYEPTEENLRELYSSIESPIEAGRSESPRFRTKQ